MTRIRPDKQIMRGPGAGYILRTDAAGELQYALLSAIIGTGNPGNPTGIISIDKFSLEGNELVLIYTDATGAQQRKAVDLSTFAVDINLSGAIVQNPTAGTYVLELTETDGSIISVNLSDLVAIATLNSADIELVGNGTPASPLQAVLKGDLKTELAARYRTDEFLNLTSGNSVTLTYTPLMDKPVQVYRNGLRLCHTDEWFNTPDNLNRIILTGSSQFGDNNLEAERMVVDYFYLPATASTGTQTK